MHVELYCYLRNLLSQSANAPFFNEVEERSKLVFQLGEFCEFDVEDCPYTDQGELASNLAFKLNQSLGAEFERIGKSVLPEQIAAWLISANTEGRYFSFRQGGAGYLNVSITEEFIRDFFTKIFAGSGESFFALQSMLGFDRVDSQTGEGTLRVEWLHRRLRTALSRSEEGLSLVESLKQRRSFDRNDQLMLLGLLADSEMEAQPYVLGLSGRQNVPWYFQRYVEDMARLRESYSPEFLVCQREGNPFNALSFRETLLTPLVMSILRIRDRYRTALRRHRPEIFVAALLDTLTEFYRIFQRPEFRITVPRSGGALMKFALLAEVQSKIVTQGLKRIEFCCEDPNFVLQLP